MFRKCISYGLLLFTTAHALDNKTNLDSIGTNYQNFLNFAGSDAVDCMSIDTKASSIFAENFRKVVNNELILEGSGKIGSHLWGFRENIGRWKINPDVYTLLSSTDDSSHVTVTYVVETMDKIEPIHQIVMAILKIDVAGKITELFEVYHPLKITNS